MFKIAKIILLVALVVGPTLGQDAAAAGAASSLSEHNDMAAVDFEDIWVPDNLEDEDSMSNEVGKTRNLGKCIMKGFTCGESRPGNPDKRCCAGRTCKLGSFPQRGDTYYCRN